MVDLDRPLHISTVAGHDVTFAITANPGRPNFRNKVVSKEATV